MIPTQERSPGPDVVLESDVMDAFSGANPLVGFQGKHVVAAGKRVLERLVKRPKAVARETKRFAGDLGRIALGHSDAKAIPADRRFDDEAWRTNPMYRRLGQAYFAQCDYLRRLVEASALDAKSTERALFAAMLVNDALAPTNTLLGNPAAVKMAVATRGRSLVKGARNLARDVADNHGMPAQVDKTAFEVGKNLALSAGAVVFRNEVLEVIQYTPRTAKIQARPVLLVPPQINKFYALDIAPGRSFVEHVVGRGIPFFTISWRNPTAAQRDWGLDTYVAAMLRATEAVCQISESRDLHVMGVCAGGLMTALLLGHLAAIGSNRVRSVTFAVTLLDTRDTGSIGSFATRAGVAAAVERSRSQGVLRGDEMSRGFAWMRPNDLVWNYWVSNYLLGGDPPAFDILYWNNDSTRLPAALHAQFLRLFVDNTLATPGAVEVLGTPIDLHTLAMDAYVLGGTTDHITPWKATYRTTRMLGGRVDYVLSSSGHIQSLVNPPSNKKARFFADGEVGESPDAWLKSATEHAGAWWDHWADWIIARSGGERASPSRLGHPNFPSLDAAPGRYVHQR